MVELEVPMILTAERDGEVIELGRGFTLETAYEFILERDCDPENPWLEGYDLVVTDGTESWLLEADCWAPV
jgi:hypothetical protein